MFSSYQQKGSALFLSLIFLLVLTVLAISTMKGSFLDEKMAANTQFKQQVFQASQSEGEGQFELYLTNHNFLQQAFDQAQPGSSATGPVNPPQQVAHNNITKDIELEYIATAQPPSGFSFGVFVGLIYSQNTESNLTNTNANSDQTLGINYAAPGNATSPF